MSGEVRIGPEALAVEPATETLESALALSVATARSLCWDGFRLRARGGSGLREVDAAIVRFFAAICGARTTGGAPGETRLSFAPGPLRAGTHRLELDGKEPLLRPLRAAAIPLGLAAAGSEIAACGSTHARGGETFEVASSTWAHLLRRIGFDVELELERAGFAPRGGGEMRLRLGGRKGELAAVDLLETGHLEALRIVSAASSLPTHVQQRQAARARSGVQIAGIDAAVQLVKLPPGGSGSTVAITGVFGGLPITVSSVLERGKSAESVGEDAAGEFRRLASVRGSLPPSLLPSLLVAAAFATKRSRFTSHRLPPMLAGHAELVRAFGGRDVQIEGKPGGPGVVIVEPIELSARPS